MIYIFQDDNVLSNLMVHAVKGYIYTYAVELSVDLIYALHCTDWFAQAIIVYNSDDIS